MRQTREHKPLVETKQQRKKVEAIDTLNKYLFHKPKDSHIPINVFSDFVKYG